MNDVFESVMGAKGREKQKETLIADSNRDALIETRTKDQYAGIPEKNKSEMWQAAIEEDGEGKKILSFLNNGKTIDFLLGESDELGVSAQRLPDGDMHDFGTRGEAIVGKFQAYKTSPDRIYGTWQSGKSNITISLDKDGDKWVIKKKGDDVPMSSIKSLVDSISVKKANDISDMLYSIKDKLTEPPNYPKNKKPLDHISLEPYNFPQVAGAGALAGATLMAIKNLGQKGFAAITGSEDDSPSIFRDMAIGGLGGAVGLGGLKFMGERNNNDEVVTMNGEKIPKEIRERYSNIANSRHAGEFLKQTGIQIRGRTATEERLENLYLKNAQEKTGAYYDNQDIENLINSDYSLTSADRRLLSSQLRMIGNINTISPSMISTMKSMGLGALAGYIAAKVLGFGSIGSIGASILGGMMGYGGSQRPNDVNGPKVHKNGFKYY